MIRPARPGRALDGRRALAAVVAIAVAGTALAAPAHLRAIRGIGAPGGDGSDGGAAAAPASQRIDASSCTDRDRTSGALLSERSVLPGTVELCHTAAVSVTARSTCHSVPMIIVLNIDISASMFGTPLDSAQSAAVGLVASLDLDANPDTLVGIVTHGREARTLLAPTNKRSLIIGRINSLRSESGDNLPDAIRRSDLELAKSSGRAAQAPLEYMVVFSDGGQDAPPEESIGPARSASSRGVQIISMCAESFYPPNCGALKDIASERRLAMDVRDASRLALHFAAESTAARTVRLRTQTIVEHLPADLDYELASAWPSAAFDPTARTLTFSPPDPKSGEFRYGYDVTPRVTGTIEIGLADARFVDTRGLAGAIEIPTTSLTVGACEDAPAAPSATPPSTPSSTPTVAPEATPDATASADPRPPTIEAPSPTSARDHPLAYLPVALFDCPARRRPVDTVLLLDAAASAERAAAGGDTDAAAARAIELAHAYAASMASGDRAAVYAVTAGAPARLASLTDDRAAIRAAIDGARPPSDARLDLALDAAVAELRSARSAPERKPVIVLLSGGRDGGGSPGSVLAAAWRAQAAATVFTIGIGRDVERELLILVAGRASRYFDGDDAGAITAIHRATEEIRQCQATGGPPGDRPLEPPSP